MGGAVIRGGPAAAAVLLTTVPRPNVAAALPTYPLTLYLFCNNHEEDEAEEEEDATGVKL